MTLLDGDYHEVDSAAMDFEIVGSMAVKEAIRKAAPTLMEPIMRLDVNVPEEHFGSVVADIGRRRGTMNEMRVRGHYRNVDGEYLSLRRAGTPPTCAGAEIYKDAG